jgi:hypothetical protein
MNQKIIDLSCPTLAPCDIRIRFGNIDLGSHRAPQLHLPYSPTASCRGRGVDAARKATSSMAQCLCAAGDLRITKPGQRRTALLLHASTTTVWLLTESWLAARPGLQQAVIVNGHGGNNFNTCCAPLGSLSRLYGGCGNGCMAMPTNTLTTPATMPTRSSPR